MAKTIWMAHQYNVAYFDTFVHIFSHSGLSVWGKVLDLLYQMISEDYGLHKRFHISVQQAFGVVCFFGYD